MGKKTPEYIIEEIKIEKLIPGGQALGQLENGKKIMLWGTLPGEIVKKVRVTKNKSTFIEGVAEEIIQKSPNRVTPKDSCYLSTSPYQILDYNYELEQKYQILLEIFQQHKIELSAEISPVQTDGRDYFYRNKMEYALYYSHEDQEIHLAFHGRGTFRKYAVNHSSIESPEIFTAAQKIINGLNANNEEARKYQMILMRCDQNGKTSGGLVENHQARPVFANLSDTILDRKYNYSPNGFFQINLPVYELALKEIIKHINTEKVLDLYAGVGTIGLSVARNKDLTLVECNGSTYRELERNCRALQNSNKIRPVLAKSEEALEFIVQNQTVIVDPPRAGLGKKLIEKFLEVTPDRIIYLSCNPITQARDIKMLLDKYDILQITPFNFFPRTPHLENLIILEHK